MIANAEVVGANDKGSGLLVIEPAPLDLSYVVEVRRREKSLTFVARLTSETNSVKFMLMSFGCCLQAIRMVELVHCCMCKEINRTTPAQP